MASPALLRLAASARVGISPPLFTPPFHLPVFRSLRRYDPKPAFSGKYRLKPRHGASALPMSQNVGTSTDISEDPTFNRKLYAPVEPYSSGYLKVSEVHSLYWEQSGNPNGYPVVFLHGGPGAGTSASNRQFFDPEFYHIILFDQRGSGKSTPHACLEENTTWDLVEDIERLRKHLKVSKWQVKFLIVDSMCSLRQGSPYHRYGAYCLACDTI